MPASQEHVTPDTPLGARLVEGGATFRIWAPGATAVHLALGGVDDTWRPSDSDALVRRGDGTWAGFFPGVDDGDLYRFWIEGPGGAGLKRDPRARELELRGYPECDCVVRGPDDYPWHDAGFRPPPFHELIVYQLHVGVFYAELGGRDVRKNRVSKFLDVLGRLEYLADLGVGAVQLLPVVEWQGMFSRGYNNTDFFSPEMDYAVPPGELAPYVERVNELLRRKGFAEIGEKHLQSQVHQLKALVDLFHVYGLAVVLDVVYNHAGGDFGDQGMRFLDQPANHEPWDPDLYFTGRDWAGGQIFDYAKPEVRQFLIDNARLFLDEYHVDGFRYDEVRVITGPVTDSAGGRFCRDLTDTLRYHRPGAVQIAEYWNDDRATAVLPTPGGLGFDAALDDRLRNAIRDAIGAAASGGRVNLTDLRAKLGRREGFPAAWRAVVHVENHDLVDGDHPPAEVLPRIPALAHWEDRRDWPARSRSRVATGLVLTAPGIPMLFMGQEFLEDKPWHNDPGRDDLFLDWAGLDAPGPMRDFLRFTRELCRLRRRLSALTGEGLNAYYVHDDDRVLAFQRWVEGEGRDVVVVATLSDSTHWSYPLPFPGPGLWREVFNSDAYDSLPEGSGYNPWTAGNGGGVTADGPPLGGLPASARIVIPANGLLVFARDAV